MTFMYLRMEKMDLYSSGGKFHNGMSFNKGLVRAYTLV